MAKVYDSERAVKAKVVEALRRSGRFGPKPLLATEFCIGQSGVRADLVVVSRYPTREVIGIEIKSAADSLQRLPRQLSVYAECFDRVIVVAAHRHQKRVRELDLPGLEIWEIEKSGSLAQVRPGAAYNADRPFSALMTQRDRVRYRGLLAHDPRDAFFAAFEDRHGASTQRFWQSLGSKRITENCIEQLSRFSVVRAASQQESDESQKYDSWADYQVA